MQRVIFSFDEESLGTLYRVKRQGEFPSLGSALREHISVLEIVLDQASVGFSQLLVRNPDINQEKQVFVPSVGRLLAKRGA